MLQPPYIRYDQLYVYYLDKRKLPTFSDPDLIGTWIEDETAILFFHRPKERLIDRLCNDCGATIVYQADLNYQDWEAGVEITSFATRYLAVRPIWEEEPAPDPARRTIVLDPSVIFGSGFHATTRLCLETLETVFFESGERIRSVLDLGTGTGLLAIAAARLGADRVTALDNNPLAVDVARRNVELNGCAAQVDVRCHDLQNSLPEMNYDLVITNLYKGLLLQLFENPGFWQPRLFMVSGFIPGMEPDLLAALPAGGVRMLLRANREQWRLWLLEKRRTEHEQS
ncbi:MAG: 50S ribosomal protein L11 methyltransferase [Desulfobulbaceae bacterium]|nr:50S ribosomal protein L11 methyltransferase [Desulfobulbaceae bacterium]